MWFLVVLTILASGEREVRIFQIEGQATCYARKVQTERVLEHKDNNVKAYVAECKKAEHT
jgi:hypothetical protein